MDTPVSVDDIVEEFDAMPDEACLYVHRQTGEILVAPDHDLGIIEDGLESEVEFEWEWEPEDLVKLHQIATTSTWVRFPGKHDLDAWSIMELFAEQAPEPLSSRLEEAIHGRGAFRLFRTAVERAGMLYAWYDFKHEHLVGFATEVLKRENIPFRRSRRRSGSRR
jgi:hypothetical protein